MFNLQILLEALHLMWLYWGACLNTDEAMPQLGFEQPARQWACDTRSLIMLNMR
jgi:hypothetical protein